MGSTSSACSAAASVVRTFRGCAMPISSCSPLTAPLSIGSTKLLNVLAALDRSTTSSSSSEPIRAGPFVSRKERMAGRLGIIAGGGGLPRRIIESCRTAGRDVFVLAVRGAAEPATMCDVPHAWCRLGAAAKGLALLRENHVTELVLAGAIRRPSLATLRPDWRAAKLLARIGYRTLGDDGLLSAVVKELEGEGFRVIGPDQLLRRCAGLRRDGPGGVLVKVEKPGQERRADRPTIGPRTVALAAETGLRGIAIEAYSTIVLDRDEVVGAADRAGLFVVGIGRP